MTSQTQKFIELTDILSFRFECKNEDCGATLSLPARKEIGPTHPLYKCPYCGSQWPMIGQFSGPSRLGGEDFETLIRELMDVIHRIGIAPLGFRMTLEIADSEKA